ncbi:MAG: ATP-binding cassette domain-containing protein, partial [Alistipes timonensis]|nr:ATP-binding cassette domain-containing protein [Alistipes timonensis]
VAEALRAVGLENFAERLSANLSDGERQKAMIARALAQDTPVMLLDEPTAFLDAASRIETLSLLRDLAASRSKAIILSTHDIAPALRLASRLWLVKPASPSSSSASLPSSPSLLPSPSSSTCARRKPSEASVPLSTLVEGTPAELAASPEGLPSLFPGRPVGFSPAAGDFLPL